jgi:hypothetical protein
MEPDGKGFRSLRSEPLLPSVLSAPAVYPVVSRLPAT